MSSRFSRPLWTLCSGVVIAMMAFGAPLADLIPLLPRTPVAIAADPAGYPGVSGTPSPSPCTPAVFGTTAVICTDYGQAQATLSKIKAKIDYQLTMAAVTGLFNVLTFIGQTLAYDTAEYIANGAKGKAPGIYTDPFGQYTKNLLLDGTGEFMGTFSERFTEGQFGFNLCRPPNFPELSLELALSFPDLSVDAIQRPRPKCSWSEITQNWSTASQSLSNAESIRNIQGYFSTGGNDVAFGIGAHVAYFNYVEERRQEGIFERLAGNGYKDVKSFISGNIQTPASLVERSVEAAIIEKPGVYDEAHWKFALDNAFNIGWVQLGVITASTFTNVLLSRLLQKIRTGLFQTSGSGSNGLPNLLDPFAVLSGSQAQQIVADQFSELKTPQVSKSGQALDLITELTGCPTGVRTQWNCAMDDSLAVVLRQDAGMTVRQAMDQGFLNPNWELVPSTRLKDNQDPGCRSRAFCVANLRKLRLARVIPVGWELAADSPANQQACAKGSCVTLGDVMNRFGDCSDTNRLDDAHPFCHLIDPNWVLTVFPAQCRTQGYGDQLLAGTTERVQECQDAVTCLERDAKGNCTGGYGYCMAEHTAWQFDAPRCEESFVSCRTFTPRTGRPVSYLRSTLDYGACNESNVGCLWYATARNPDPEAGSDAWVGGVVPASANNPTLDRVYFDKNVAACDASQDGCASLRRVEAGKPALNLIPNGSFEQLTTDDAGTTLLEGWYGGPYQPPEVASGAASAHGAQAVLVTPDTGDIGLGSGVAIVPLRQYTLSFYARRNAGAPQGAGVRIQLLQAYGASIVHAPGEPTYYRSSGCSEVPSAVDPRDAMDVKVSPDTGDAWTRFSCSFVAPAGAGLLSVSVSPGSTAASSPLVDAIQLEEGGVPTAFVDGLNASLASVAMKVPPSELACAGDDATDNPLCANYARVCRQTEAGCQGYRPSGGGSAPEVPAVLTSADVCPAECAGYAEFRKQASTFDLVRSPDPRLDDPEDDTSAFFIPQTGAQCRAQDVGCELFTNLDALSQGGESQEAFRYLRSCEKPGTDSQTYYTWEGSDTSGYQLNTWSLKRDVDAPAPQGPKIVEKTGSDGTLKDPLACNEQTYLQALDPDCRQFYDPQGNVSYRFESQTVLSSPDCRSYRKEGSTAADCTKTGGTHNPATGQCTYLAEPRESLSCAPAVSGCRAYVGTQGKAQEETFFEEFAGTAFQATASLTGSGGAAIAASDEALLVGDRSLRIQRNGGQNTVFIGPMDLQTGVLYEVSFWARAGTPGASLALAATAPNADPVPVGSVALAPEWRTARVGPFTTPLASPEDYLSFTITGSDLTFIDKVRVERVQDVAYVIKDSWNTPAVCDATPEGIPQPQAMLGCRAYTDRAGAQVTVRQFTSLCRETAIGCTAYVNTMNTPSAYAQSFTRAGATPSDALETTVVPGDQYGYYIEDASKFCRSEAVGCRAFGKPNFSQDRLGLDAEKPFTTVYLQPDPSAYDDALCSEAELFCEAYTYAVERGGSGESGTTYFRAPADHACEYRQSVVVPDGTVPGVVTAGQVFDGWFRTGTDAPCYPDQLKSGSMFDLRLTGDPGFNPWAAPSGTATSWRASRAAYQGWTGACPAQAAECTEFRDVNDTSDILHPQGRPYFVIRNGEVDETSCNGQVDPGRGCVLFRDTSDAQFRWNAAATYDLYQSRAYQPVAPVDCVQQPDHPSCASAGGLCQGVAVQCRPGETCPPDISGLGTSPGLARVIQELEGSACSADADCAFEPDPGVIWHVSGTCAPANNANAVIKVKPDRACSEWLSCSTAETVYDPQEGRYKSICADLALCNKAGSVEGDDVPFCANYINRSYQSSQTLLKEFAVMDAPRYASRKTGFGAQDYAGATIPDHYQVMDAELVPIASMLSTDPRIQTLYKKDYRLAVPVPIQRPFAPPTGLGAIALWTSQLGYRALPGVSASISATMDPALRLYACTVASTRAAGIMTDDDGDLANLNTATICWASLDQGKPPALGVSGADSLISPNLNVPALLARFSPTGQTALDQTLSRSFPDTQCKAAPEADSPFGGAFVVEWDDSVNPPVPKRVAPGYSQVNFCEYGEACACTYKRVEYGTGNARFYEPLSTNVVNAVCVGGSRPGQPCTLDTGVSGNIPTGTITSGEGDDAVTLDVGAYLRGENAGAPDPNAICGEGGTCRAISAVRLVRGASGQCLQYDLSRTVGGDLSRNECLFWNPTPVFQGPGDPYHWIPTAGFQPPQSSGRYYCTAPFRAEKTFQLRPTVTEPVPGHGDIPISNALGFVKNSVETYAGQIRRFTYSDAIASDKSCLDSSDIPWWVDPTGITGAVVDQFGCDGNESGGSLDGSRSLGTDMGQWCEQADDDQRPSKDASAVRFITTGRGANLGYTEYAILADTGQIGKMIAGYDPQAKIVSQEMVDIITENSYEDTISNFTFTPPTRKLGCAYSEDWVDGIGSIDYNKQESWKPQDAIWQAGFRRELAKNGGVLDRRHSQIVTEDGTPDGIPVKVDCQADVEDDTVKDNDPNHATGCYLKVWTLDYRAESVPTSGKFQAFSPEYGRISLDHLSRAPVYTKCDASQSWFSIRAVFEDTNVTENGKEPEEISPQSMVGPFQFVGFWVTACSPQSGPRYIYMRVGLSTADVCRELAETISRDSHDNAAFTDRNWSQGAFTMPRNGFQWATTNIPFGASLATRDAGEEPLYMSGVRQANANPLHPPAFTYAGQTYFRPEAYPTSNWGLLSNVFARIYRIYAYSPHGVSADEWACTDPASPNFGQWCPSLDDDTITEDKRNELSALYCGFDAKCIPAGLSGEDALAVKACNSFSGVNRGLDCTYNPDICHEGPMTLDQATGAFRPAQTACEPGRDVPGFDGGTQTWTQVSSNGRWRCAGSGCAPVSDATCGSCNGNPGSSQLGCTRAIAAHCGAFRCDSNSARSPSRVTGNASYCTRPSDDPGTEEQETSAECPLNIDGEFCDGATPGAAGLLAAWESGQSAVDAAVAAYQAACVSGGSGAGDPASATAIKNQWRVSASRQMAEARDRYDVVYSMAFINCVSLLKPGDSCAAADPSVQAASEWRRLATEQAARALAAPPSSAASLWVGAATTMRDASRASGYSCAASPDSTCDARLLFTQAVWQASASAAYDEATAAAAGATPDCDGLLDAINAAVAAQASAAAGLAALTPGRCEDHPWAQCLMNEDCHYHARNFWLNGPANQSFVWSTANRVNRSEINPYILGNWMPPIRNANNSDDTDAAGGGSPFLFHYGFPYHAPTVGDGSWGEGAEALMADDGKLLRNAFAPAYLTPDEPLFSAQAIAPSTNSVWDVAEQERWNDFHLLRLSPGFAPLISRIPNSGSNLEFSPNFGTAEAGAAGGGGFDGSGAALAWVDVGASFPYGFFAWNEPADDAACRCSIGYHAVNGLFGFGGSFCTADNSRATVVPNTSCLAPPRVNATEIAKMRAHYAACEPRALMFRVGVEGSGAAGTCRGGARAGALCFADTDCRPVNLSVKDFNAVQREAQTWCNPAATNGAGNYAVTADNTACWVNPSTAASEPNFPSREQDSMRDNNICTHPPGYWPRPNLCKDPNDEYCGLLGYDLTRLNPSVNDGQPLPTDVTPGFSSPSYLNPDGSNISENPDLDYNYIAYNNPVPPLVAAPDIRSCQGGACHTSPLRTIGVDGLSGGTVSGGAGSHVATLRFYAWAQHDQMPLRRLTIDWGDGNLTELPDAFLKNHKPYCGGVKECSNAPGLTCQTDTDCPTATSGSCVSYGTCDGGGNPGRRCTDDRQCDSGGEQNGVCQPRVFFGNSVEACEEQYFEFRHAYSCLPGSQPAAACPTEGRCSSDQNRSCSVNADCGGFDQCILNMAPEGGCFNSATQFCRFTPRVLLQDNWGWCSGECRAVRRANSIAEDAPDAPVLHPNGGCYDGALLRSNETAQSLNLVNECDPSFPASNAQYRPWIVFGGSIQLLSGETQ